MPRKNQAGCGCCGGCKTDVELFTTSDWTVDSGTLASNPSGGNDWLDLSGTITPGATLAVESYVLQFFATGDLDVTIDGKVFGIDTAAGTVTADAVSADIRQDSEATNTTVEVQIRATPTHTYISVMGEVDYGTSYTEEDVGVMLTYDRSSNPSGSFTISGTGSFYNFTIKDSTTSYPLYGSLSECPWAPMLPKVHRIFEAILDFDGSKLTDRYEIDSTGTNEFWFPGLSWTGPTYSSSSSTHDFDFNSDGIDEVRIKCYDDRQTDVGFTCRQYLEAEADNGTIKDGSDPTDGSKDYCLDTWTDFYKDSATLTGYLIQNARTVAPGTTIPDGERWIDWGDAEYVENFKSTTETYDVAFPSGTETLTSTEVFYYLKGQFRSSLDEYVRGRFYYRQPEPSAGTPYPKPIAIVRLQYFSGASGLGTDGTTESEIAVNTVKNGGTISAGDVDWTY